MWQLAFRYLSRALFPLLLIYAVYSLVYHEHRGWYSYTVNMLAGAVYTFGFIMMTPQLFINYKLQSVAHLPWRMLTYKVCVRVCVCVLSHRGGHARKQYVHTCTRCACSETESI